MARVVIEESFPFTSWDAERRYGRSDYSIKVTTYIETAKSKAGLYPYRVETSYPIGDETRYDSYEYSNVRDALKRATEEVHAWARVCGWTPEAE